MSKRKYTYDESILEALDNISDEEPIIDDSDADPDYDPQFSGFSDDEECDRQQRNIEENERELESQLGAMAMESDEENENRPESNVSITEWTEFRGRQKNFQFTGREGVTVRPNNLDTLKPEDVFDLIIDEEILKLLVIETNRYAQQTTQSRQQSSSLTPEARHRKWVPTTLEEIKTFLGLLLWMELDQKGSISSYWSTSDLYSNNISHKMSRNRFEILLNCFHFADNESIMNSDRLGKIQPKVYDVGLKSIIDFLVYSMYLF